MSTAKNAAKQLQAVARSEVGKGAARAVRRQGQVPAVIYGAGKTAEAIALNANETRRLIFAGHFMTTVFEIDVAGTKTRVIPRDYQLDPVKDVPIHVDFFRLTGRQPIKVTVPVHVVDADKAPGVKRGGTVQVVEHSIDLMVPPDAIPESIEISVAKLDIGEAVHLEDIVLPDEAKAVVTENITLVSLVAPTVEAEPEEAEGEAAEGDAKADAKKSDEPAKG